MHLVKQTAAAVACARGEGGIWHFDARIMDFAPAAAIVKENKRLSERPSQEFNAAHKKKKRKRTQNKHGGGGERLVAGGRRWRGTAGGLICRQIDLFFHLVLQI